MKKRTVYILFNADTEKTLSVTKLKDAEAFFQPIKRGKITKVEYETNNVVRTIIAEKSLSDEA